MRFLWKVIVVGLMFMTFAALPAFASITIQLSLVVSPSFGSSGTWQAFEQNIYTNGSTSSGLDDITFGVSTTGAVQVTSAHVALPTSFDPDSSSANGFSVFRSNGSISGGQLTAAAAAQSFTYSVNPAGDVYNVFQGIGDVAETIPVADDGTGNGGNGDAPGNLTTIHVALPVLIGFGNWSNSGPAGTMTIVPSVSGTSLLPSPMPAPDGRIFQGMLADAATGNTVSIVPEPMSASLILIGGLGFLGRRRRNFCSSIHS
jgi:hypothetical protein